MHLIHFTATASPQHSTPTPLVFDLHGVVCDRKLSEAFIGHWHLEATSTTQSWTPFLYAQLERTECDDPRVGYFLPRNEHAVLPAPTGASVCLSPSFIQESCRWEYLCDDARCGCFSTEVARVARSQSLKVRPSRIRRTTEAWPPISRMVYTLIVGSKPEAANAQDVDESWVVFRLVEVAPVPSFRNVFETRPQAVGSVRVTINRTTSVPNEIHVMKVKSRQSLWTCSMVRQVITS